MDSPTPRRAAAVALTLASIASAGHLAPVWGLWAGPSALAVTGALAVGVAVAVAMLWRGSSHRRAVGAALLLIGTAFLALDAAGVRLTAVSIGPTPYAALLAGATGIAGIGILLRRRGARWLGLGLAAAGAVSSGLNLSQWMLAGVADATSWALSVWTLGSLAVLALLCGRSVAEQDRLAAHEQVWTHRDPIVRWMRAATISAIVAIPMLLVYALGQAQAVDEIARVSPLLAGFLAVGAFLSARGQLLGGALLALGALALLALSASAIALAPAGVGARVAGYYMVFWLPAVACGLACGVSLAHRAARR